MKHKSNHKPHTAKKHHKKGAKRKGLSGVAKVKAASKKGMAEMATPAGVLVGLVAASVASNLMDKVPFLAPDATKEGFQVKSIIKPLALAAIGAGTAYMTHGKSGGASKFANGVGYGLVGGAVFITGKVVLKKSLVSGLGSADDGTAKLEATYYKERAEDMAKMLEKAKFTPELPAIEGAPVEEHVESPELHGGENVYNPSQDLDVESMDTVV